MGADHRARPVVAGVDGSECALHAVRWAAAEEVRRHRPLRLVAAHTWPSGTRVGTPDLGVDRRPCCARWWSVGSPRLRLPRRRWRGTLPVEQVETTGSPVAVLQAESTRAELVVLGDRGLGGLRRPADRPGRGHAGGPRGVPNRRRPWTRA